MSGVYRHWAPLYRERGYWPRPIHPGTKACKVKDWQKPDDDLAPSRLREWDATYADHGVSLKMGSLYPDGSVLVAVDIDRDEYVRLAKALLRHPVCGRIGKKGIVLFARLIGDARRRQFAVRPTKGAEPVAIGELLGERTLCVIPPTIHPETSQPYRWEGKSLLDVDYTDLPLIKA